MNTEAKQPLKWYYGLVPPAWSAAQMLIFFTWPQPLVFGNRIWLVLWILEAFATFVLMMRWLLALGGPMTGGRKRVTYVGWGWIAFCFVAYRIIDHFNPSPNYSKFSGSGHSRDLAMAAAGDAWSLRSVELAIGYMLVMVTGMLILLWLYHKKKLFGGPSAGVLSSQNSPGGA